MSEEPLAVEVSYITQITDPNSVLYNLRVVDPEQCTCGGCDEGASERTFRDREELRDALRLLRDSVQAALQRTFKFPSEDEIKLERQTQLDQYEAKRLERNRIQIQELIDRTQEKFGIDISGLLPPGTYDG